MRIIPKRKKLERENFDDFIGYKKRLVCAFRNCEEQLFFYEKKIFFNKKKQENTISGRQMLIEANGNSIKPIKLLWNNYIKDDVLRLIKPDFLLKQIIELYDKDKYAVVLYDEKKTKNVYEIIKEAEECKNKNAYYNQNYIETSIEIEEDEPLDIDFKDHNIFQGIPIEIEH